MVLLPSVFGPTGLLSGVFQNPANILLGLAFLIPLILLYLIRPKPVNVAVPSLMFILNDMGKSNIHRLFRTIFRDVLFIIQGLVLLLLIFAMAKPFINVEKESLVQQSILVVDTSASTRAFGDDRFDTIRNAAIEALASENIIIAARANPQVLSENDNPRLSSGRAKNILEDMQPTDVPGDLPSALDLAAQYAGPESKVTIVSDFVLSSLESNELIAAKIKVLRSKGALVDTIPIGDPGNNVGIIDAQLSSQNATVTLKIQNFDDTPREIGLEYNGQAIVLPKNLLEPQGKPGSLLSVSVPLAHGRSEFVLTPKDDFMTDNHYYVSIPDLDAINVLIITNDPAVQSSKLVPALTAAGDQFTRVNIAYGIPPKVPDLDHQVYVMKDVNAQFVLPGVLKELHDKVSEGAVLVVYAQPGLFALDMHDLLPVTAKSLDPLTGRQELMVNSSLGLLKGLSDIGQASGDQLLRVDATADAIVHAYVETNDGPEPVIAHRRIGKGVVLYYGIKDQKAIDLDPQSFAVIWGRIVDYSLPDVRALNAPTGNVITSTTRTIITPMGKQTSPVTATRAGFYQPGQLTIAANLYPLAATTGTTAVNIQYESLISKPANISAQDIGTTSESEASAKVPWDLTVYALMAGVLLLLFELLYIKYRGDL